jgi:Fic family protein
MRTVAGEEIAAFVPYPLPPRDPPLNVDGALAAPLRRAEQALARLEVAGEMVPSLDWFIYAFVRKEAVISSQIEGTQATLIDLLEYEAEPTTKVAGDDVHEVCNYLDAIKYARGQIRSARGLPLSIRLLNEAHRRLMRRVRGADKQPGEIRRGQNWIGGTRPGNAVFVPAPPEELAALLADLERYLHKGNGLPPLVRIGLAHVQFETIHPYLDGNGRIGRLLITLLLEHWKLLSAPLLYLSLFFKRHRTDYYRLLGEVRRSGDWEAWIEFFLEGVATIADEAVIAARELFALVAQDRQRLVAAAGASVMAIRLMDHLPIHPVVTIPAVVKLLKTTKPTAGKAVQLLENLGVLTETTGKQRDRTFAYASYLEKLRVGTEVDVS